jgi:hypothetical protein
MQREHITSMFTCALTHMYWIAAVAAPSNLSLSSARTPTRLT